MPTQNLTDEERERLAAKFWRGAAPQGRALGWDDMTATEREASYREQQATTDSPQVARADTDALADSVVVAARTWLQNFTNPLRSEQVALADRLRHLQEQREELETRIAALEKTAR